VISYSRRRSTTLADASALTDARRVKIAGIADDMRSMAELSQRVRKALSTRERVVMEVGLRMAHAEEAIATGDAARAKAHGEALEQLLEQLRINRISPTTRTTK